MNTAEHRLMTTKARERADRAAEHEDRTVAAAAFDMTYNPLTARQQAAHRERIMLRRAESHEARADWREARTRLEVAS